MALITFLQAEHASKAAAGHAAVAEVEQAAARATAEKQEAERQRREQAEKQEAERWAAVEQQHAAVALQQRQQQASLFADENSYRLHCTSGCLCGKVLMVDGCM